MMSNTSVANRLKPYKKKPDEISTLEFRLFYILRCCCITNAS